MRVLIVNTSERTGGAAVAANRLKDALNNNGVKAKMLVRDRETDDITVVGLSGKMLSRWRFLWERWCIFCHLHFKRERLFDIDIANTGHDITSLPEFKEADVIHLHWINQGMLGLSDIKKILSSGKPVVWTMHDLWPATAICHYSRGCHKFHSGCGNCRLLPNGGGDNDLAAKVWRKKKAILRNNNISFVTCSQWLGNQAKLSGLLQGQRVASIPNAIDTQRFCPGDKAEARLQFGLPSDKRLILFVSQRVTDERKGMSYFVDAIEKLAAAHPEMKESAGIVVLGGHAEDVADQLALPVYPLGYVSDPKKVISVYNSVDIFVMPSLEDNLPNTIMEAMACGVPCVGFRTGGIPEMIDHRKNGYVADYRDCKDLAQGILCVLDDANYALMSAEAVRKVQRTYSRQAVAMKYIEVYNHALAFKHYKI